MAFEILNEILGFGKKKKTKRFRDKEDTFDLIRDNAQEMVKRGDLPKGTTVEKKDITPKIVKMFIKLEEDFDEVKEKKGLSAANRFFLQGIKKIVKAL